MPATVANTDIDEILREVGPDSTATFDTSSRNPTEHASSENLRLAPKDDDEDVEDDEDEDLDDEDDLDDEEDDEDDLEDEDDDEDDEEDEGEDDDEDDEEDEGEDDDEDDA